ncbi:MAG: uroporphyrinogen decarboxylase [Vicinamibacteria bacterium]
MKSRFIDACARRPVDATPVWFMRQAGRYMSEYRALRKKHALLEICRTPELAVQVTLQPLERLGVDAAILFSDLLIPLVPMGVELDFIHGEGPKIENPVATSSDVEKLRDYEPREALGFTMEAIRQLRRELEGKVPLIGFAGAPFTLASYLIEGGSSRSFAKTKALMYSDPTSWHRLASKLASMVRRYLLAQIEAGAQAVQLFDSWAGALSPQDYREFVLPHSRAVLDGLEDGRGARDGPVPLIHFATGNSSLLPLLREAGGSVIGLDWRVDLDVGWDLLGDGVAVQGNLDPAVLLGPPGLVRDRADDILARAGARPGHIFNLGHGVLPNTPVDTVADLVRHVHEKTAR